MSNIIYILFVSFSLIIAKVYESTRINKSTKKLFLFILWVFIVSFVSIRFDVGNDYANYAYYFYDIIHSKAFIAYDKVIFAQISYLFSFSDKGYIGVFASYFIITFTLVLLTLKKYNIIFLGLLTFFLFGFFFDSLDRIRQFVAVAIFMYSFENIKNNNFIIFFLKILLASIFHVSAIFLIPFYYIVKIKINNFFLILIFISLGILIISGSNSDLLNFIYTNIPYYNSIYQNTNYIDAIDQGINSGLGVMAKILFLMMLIYFAKIHYKYKNILLIGLLLYALFPGNLSIVRISSYFLSITLIVFPFFINSFVKKENKLFFVLPMFFLLIIMFLKSLNSEYFQYQTIFSTNFEYEIFKTRIYN